jgi:ABC-type sugar transport system permease subunit
MAGQRSASLGFHPSPLLLYLVFFIVPLSQSIYISFTDWNGIRPTVN